MLQIQSTSFVFSEESSNTAQHTFDFGNTIQDYGVALQGFDLNHGTDKDREIRSIGAQITNYYPVDDDKGLYVEVKFTMEDHRDHVGEGIIDIVAFADVKS